MSSDDGVVIVDLVFSFLVLHSVLALLFHLVFRVGLENHDTHLIILLIHIRHPLWPFFLTLNHQYLPRFLTPACVPE